MLFYTTSDYETAGELIRDDDIAIKDIKKKLQQAKVALKRSKSKDLYATLSVSRGADDDEIKKAYKKAALKYHPDKQAGKSEDDQNISIAMYF
jgi:DnaJ family protein C protein 7